MAETVLGIIKYNINFFIIFIRLQRCLSGFRAVVNLLKLENKREDMKNESIWKKDKLGEAFFELVGKSVERNESMLGRNFMTCKVVGGSWPPVDKVIFC